MQRSTPRLIGLLSLVASLLLGVGFVASEAHVRALEEAALASLPAVSAAPAWTPVAAPNGVDTAGLDGQWFERRMTVEEFHRGRAAQSRRLAEEG